MKTHVGYGFEFGKLDRSTKLYNYWFENVEQPHVSEGGKQTKCEDEPNRTAGKTNQQIVECWNRWC